ncbi:flocculation protein FLO11-like [Hippoglossus hippoglossus]|uniref:flocculation protein FLO11-like n=1 Tax=Hippoglossus hippoglossus TaxID=8267 RepID=UPI00148DB9B0|nr:flocculation protein FLO11-like [Hippoglossus hippoglossus]
MLLLPAAALCCLCSALVAMAAELTQDQLSLTMRVGDRASFSCGGTDQCGRIFWFQKKDTGTFRQILYIRTRDGYIYKGFNHPQKDDFTAEREQNSWELKIKKVKPSHAATYYCACWKSGTHSEKLLCWREHERNTVELRRFLSESLSLWMLIFGSGTKLFVTASDTPVVKPVVSVYPAASKDALDRKSSLLCVASNMSPPLVQFSWTRQREGEKPSPAEGEQLELREEGRTASIMVVDRDASYTYTYSCHVRHEDVTVEAPAEQVVCAPAPTAPAPTTPAPTPPAPTPPAQTAPAQTAPAQTTPAQTTPAPTTPAQTTQAPATPAQTTPAPTAPAPTSPAQTAPAQTTPAQTTPAQTAPAQTTPAPTAPAQTTPAQTTPAPTTPAPTAPAPTPPAQTTPAQTPPAQTTPALTAPAPTPPAPTAPAQTAPAQTAPAAWAWSERQVKLLCLLYTLLMVKSLVYCCGLALIHILRNRERPAAAHETTEFPAAASTSH